MEKIIHYGCMGAFIVAAIIASVFLPRRELRTIAQVSGIAIDRKDDLMSITFELFEPSMEQPYGEERTIVNSMGKTIEECIKNASLSIGKELYVDDAAVLIIGDKGIDAILNEVKRYYKEYKQDHMDLPLIRARNQTAAEIFKGKGKILSIEIAESMRLMGKRTTIKELLNGVEPDIFIKGEGKYEIIS